MSYHWQGLVEATDEAINQLAHMKMQFEEELLTEEQFGRAIAAYIGYLDNELERLRKEATAHNGMPYCAYLESKADRLRSIREKYNLFQNL